MGAVRLQWSGAMPSPGKPYPPVVAPRDAWLNDFIVAVLDATMHSSDRMVRQVYDRRRVRVAKPTR